MMMKIPNKAMFSSMPTAASHLLIGVVLAMGSQVAVADWPQANGPSGNFNPKRYGHRLVDDLSKARKLWVCGDADLGFAKGSSSGYLRHLSEDDTHPGAASGLIVAEGKVFASSFRPSGEIWAEHMPHLKQDKNRRFAEGDAGAVLRRNAAIIADDFTVAIDLKTGAIVWKSVEKGKGLNRYSGKRNHFGVSPAYHKGKVFSLGTSGVIYCYDAEDGDKLWENADGALVAIAAEERRELLEKRGGFASGDAMGASLVVAQGVLVVPEFTGGRDIGLRGIDVGSGKTLWTVEAATCRHATPAVWSHGDRQYLLCATVGQHNRHDSAKLRLIDSKDGKVLWTETGLAATWYPLSPSADHVMANVPSAHINPKKAKDGQPWGLMAAYRITPDGAERAWTMPEKAPFWFENHMDICAMRRVLIRDGRVYFFAQGHTVDADKSSRFFSILDEKTGEVLLTTEAVSGSPQFWLIEDRLLVMPDAAHSGRSTLELFAIDPKGFRRLAEPWKPPHENTTAYETYMELPYVDGLFLMRNQQGSVICYDLRAEARKTR